MKTRSRSMDRRAREAPATSSVWLRSAAAPSVVSAAAAMMLLLLGARSAPSQPRMEEVRDHIVVVRGFDAAGRALGDISGFAVGDGRVLSAAAPLLDAEELLVVLPEAGDEFEAEVVALDERSGVALLRTGGGAPGGLSFVAPGVTPSEGDIVHLPRFAADGTLDAELDRGAVATLDRLRPTAAGEPEILIFRHGAPAAVPQYGMPLLNDCGEVVGLLRTDPGQILDERSSRPEPGLAPFAVAASSILDALEEAGIATGVSDDPCPSATDRLAAAEAGAEAARRRADEEGLRAQTAEDRVRVAEAEREAAEAEREAAEARGAAAEAERDAAEARARLAEAEAAERIRRNRDLAIAIAVVAALALMIGLLVARRLRKRRKQLAASEAAIEQAITPAAISCLLEGADDSGRTYALKVSAEQLGAADGVVVGRNPAQAGVLLDHPEVSRQHFRLTAGDDGIVISDLRSTNGTFLNDEPLQPDSETRVEDGAAISVGEGIALRLRVSRIES